MLNVVRVNGRVLNLPIFQPFSSIMRHQPQDSAPVLSLT